MGKSKNLDEVNVGDVKNVSFLLYFLSEFFNTNLDNID